jgi:magnesium chelatase family protein
MERAIQQERFDRLNQPCIRCNDNIGRGEVYLYCKLDKECLTMIRLAVERMGLSTRAYHRVQKLSRTIVDLAGNVAGNRRTWPGCCSIGRELPYSGVT